MFQTHQFHGIQDQYFKRTNDEASANMKHYRKSNKLIIKINFVGFE